MSGQRQLSRAELRTLDPHQVRAALKEGRLAQLLAGRQPEPPPSDNDHGDDDQTDDDQTKQLSKDDLKAMTPEEVRDALRAGQLAQLLGQP